jgi:anti-sigma B factor antagonist
MSQGFVLETSREDDVLVIRVSGELDLAARESFIEAVEAGLSESAKVVADVGDLVFIDSSGLSAFIRCRNTAGRSGGHFSVRGAQGQVADVLTLSGLAATLTASEDGAAGR